MSRSRAILLVGLLFTLAAMWLGRYQLTSAAEGSFVYRIDRWTGDVRVYTPSGWNDVSNAQKDNAIGSPEEGLRKYDDSLPDNELRH